MQHETAGSVSLEDVTQAAVSGALRALEARQVGRQDFFLPWPILVGIILNPGEAFLAALPTGAAQPAPDTSE